MQKIILLLFLPLSLFGQYSKFMNSEWDNIFDKGRVFYQALEGTNGWVYAVGETKNQGKSKTDGFLVIREFSTGSEIAVKIYGDLEEDQLQAVVQTADGHFYLAGTSTDPRGKGKSDGWLIKVDERGEQVWETFIGTPGEEQFVDLVLLKDGSIVVAGYQKQKRESKVWVTRVKDEGDGARQIWSRILDGDEFSTVEKVVYTTDDRILLAGNTPRSKKYGNGNAWMLQVKEDTGENEWESAKFIGEKKVDQVTDLIVRQDGALNIAGFTNSDGFGKIDMWLQKVSSTGQKIGFMQTFGGRDDDQARAIVELGNGNLVLVGKTLSHKRGARVPKAYIVETNPNGVMSSETPWGDDEEDEFKDVIELHDGSVLIVGSTKSKGKGENAWMVKFANTNDRISGIRGEADVNITDWYLNTDDGFLKPDEQSYVSFKMAHKGYDPIYNIKVEVQYRSSNLIFGSFEQNFFHNIPANRPEVFKIPVLGSAALETGENEVELLVYSGNRVIKTEKFTIRTKNPQPALLRIAGQLPGYEGEQRNSPKKITLKVANSGDRVSERATVEFRVPRGIQPLSQARVSLGDILPGANKTVEFRFRPTPQFVGDNVNITCVISDNSRTQTESIPMSLISRSGGGFGDEYFAYINPNPAMLDQSTLNWNKPEINIQGYFKSKSSSIQAQDVSSYINGIKLDRSKADEVDLTPPRTEGKDFYYNYTQKIQLQEGENRIRIESMTANGIIQSTEVIVNYQPNKPNLHILAIGPPHSDLKYTSKDAEDFANIYLNQQGDDRVFKNVYVNKLTSQNNTVKLSIQSALNDLWQRHTNYGKGTYENEISRNDILIVFISSHGKEVNNRFNILTADHAQFGDIANIDYQIDVLSVLDRIDCKKLVFIDACHSGAAGGKQLLGQAREALEMMNQQYPSLNVLSSSQVDEVSYEDAAWQNGAFTEAILEAFSGQSFVDDTGSFKADANDNRIISLGELYNFLRRRVPGLVRSKKGDKNQMPDKKFDQGTDDLPVYVLYN